MLIRTIITNTKKRNSIIRTVMRHSISVYLTITSTGKYLKWIESKADIQPVEVLSNDAQMSHSCAFSVIVLTPMGSESLKVCTNKVTEMN